MSEASSGGVRSEGLLDGVDDGLEGLLEGHPHLLAREDHRLGQPGHEVAPADLGLHLLGEREGGADLELHLLGRLLADHQLVLALDVVDDRLVELVAADADRLRHDDAAERDHRHLAGAAADVHHHVAGGLAHRQAGADRRRHRLLDQVGLARSGRQAGLLDGALLDPGHPGGHADHHARVRPAVLVHLLDEVAQHLLGHVEVGDHAVLERPDRLDRARACGPASAWPRSRRRAPRRCASRSPPRTAPRARSRVRARRRACLRCRGPRPYRGRPYRSVVRKIPLEVGREDRHRGLRALRRRHMEGRARTCAPAGARESRRHAWVRLGACKAKPLQSGGRLAEAAGWPAAHRWRLMEEIGHQPQESRKR